MVTGDAGSSHKVGRFNWGPVSLSRNETGSLVAMIKWKGDDRKLAFLDVEKNTFEVSRFSCFSYVLFETEIVHVLSNDVMVLDPATGKSRSITPAKVRRGLLELVGLGQRSLDDTMISLGALSLLEGGLVARLGVQDGRSYDHLWQGIVSLPHEGREMRVVYRSEPGWFVRGIASGGGLWISLERYESMKLAETRLVGTGEAAAALQSGWRPLANPRLPELGFQFLPGSG